MVWGIKARWIQACVISNKRSGVQTGYMLELTLNNYSTVSIVSRYRVVIKVVFTSQHNWEHYQKKCRNKKEKSLKMKRDVGMACQKVHKQGRIKVMVNIQSLIHPYIFSQKSKDVGIGLCIFTITFILPCSCTFWHAIPTSLFIFNNVMLSTPET